MARRWMVTYDVAQQRSRSQLATLLEARGPRVLYSVFEIELDQRQCDRLVDRASCILGGGDSLLVLPICSSCRTWRYGSGIETDPREWSGVVGP